MSGLNPNHEHDIWVGGCKLCGKYHPKSEPCYGKPPNLSDEWIYHLLERLGKQLDKKKVDDST